MDAGALAPVAPTPLGISTTSLPDGTVYEAYSATLVATGGTPSYSCKITADALPAGLVLSASGDISGTPTMAESQNFTVEVTDSDDTPATDTQLLSITIAPAAQGDVVTVTKAVYSSRKAELTLEATSSASAGGSAPGLQITHMDGVKLDSAIDMTYNPKKDKNSAKVVDLASKPLTVTVTSSGGGSATRAVGGK